jgi:modulator of FtsH protease HflK
LDKIEAGDAPPTMEDEAVSAPFALWGVVKTALGDLFRIPRLGRRGVASLVGVVIASWLSTAFYRVQPDEKGVVLRFGKWVATTDPGLHVHLPYRIDTVLLPKVTQINQV